MGPSVAAAIGLAQLPAWACDDATDATEVSAAIRRAEQALGALDQARFAVAADEVRGAIPCLRAPIDASTAAAVHRIVGIAAYTRQDPLAPLALAAARRLAPDTPPDPTLFPPTSGVASAWSAVDTSALATTPIPRPASGWIALDGERASERRAGLPVVAQVVDDEGGVVVSAYLAPDEPLPTYAIYEPPPEVSERHPLRVGLAVATVATGITAATTLGLAADSRSRYLDLDDPVPDASLDGLRARTNAFGGVWVASAVACLGSGIALAVTW